MGFLDKIKSAKNYLTGGGAKLFVEVLEPGFDEPFSVRVRAEVSDSDLKINGVYLKIKGEEEVIIPDVLVADRTGDDVEVRRENVARETVTFEATVQVEGAQTLDAGQTYEWEVQVTLNDDCLPTYDGPLAKHWWLFLAGLDKTGNDPDSGWTAAEIY